MMSSLLETRLSEEERRYLRRLFLESDLEQDLDYVELEAPGIGRGMLLRALSQLSSELVASDGRYYLRFQVSVAEDRLTGTTRLRLSLPEITDRDGVERCARVRPGAGEVVVLDPAGRLQGPEVVDISSSGLALRPAGGRLATTPGTRIDQLRVFLPRHRPISVSGRVVRVDGEGERQHIALAFDELPNDAALALRRYVFTRYSGS